MMRKQRLWLGKHPETAFQLFCAILFIAAQFIGDNWLYAGASLALFLAGVFTVKAIRIKDG